MNPEEVSDLIEALEGEVDSGGFHQFFFNSSGDRTMDTIQALEAIGAATTASILKRAAERFPNASPPIDRFARQEVLLNRFPDVNSFRDLDLEFYSFPDDLGILVRKYQGQVNNT